MSTDQTVHRAGASRHRRRVARAGLLTLCVLGILAYTLHSLRVTDASFTAASPGGPSVFVTGTLSHVNDRNGQLVVAASGLVPGDGVTGTMTLTGTGNGPGNYYLVPSSLVDAPAAPALSDELVLTIEETTGGVTTTLYDDTVSDFMSAEPPELGTIAPEATRSYEVTLSYPDGPAEGTLQGASLSLVLEITGVSQ